jgi:hypothetical protein
MDDKKISIEQITPVKYQPENQIDATEQFNQILTLVTLGTCLLIGVVSTFLFDGKTWGLNMSLFGLLLVGSLLLLRNLGQEPLNLVEYMLVASGLFFTVALAWRDSLVLNSLSLLGIFLTINLAFTLGTRQRLKELHVYEAFEDLYASSKYGIISYYDLINQDIQWKMLRQQWGEYGRATLKGLIITVPLIILFGILFTASDARFEDMVAQLFDWGWNEEIVVQYTLAFVISSWIAVAVLRGGVLKQGLNVKEEYITPPPSWTLGSIEIVMILGALNILFLSFIAVQFTYFFGGDALVQSAQGPTYANYARRGFEELVTVAVLVITLLLLTHWLQSYTQLEKRLYQILAVLMVLMTMIIEASAAHRMYLYTREYGLTELRFYTSVFMVWLIVLFIWFTLTVLREKRARFSFGAILTGMVFIGMLHFINPDARIVQINLARLQAGETFDAGYVSTLSADAVPSLVAALPALPESERCELWANLRSHKVLHISDEWRNFNFARAQGRDLLLSVTAPSKCQ